MATMRLLATTLLVLSALFLVLEEVKSETGKEIGLFDFAQFELRFHKHYASLVEELVRQKIFLGRALHALISKVEYRLKRLPYYLDINHRSDETLEERKQERLTADKLVESPQKHRHHLANHIDIDEELPLAEPEEIRHLLEEIESHQRDSPANAELAKGLLEELDEVKGVRNKRSSPTEKVPGASYAAKLVQAALEVGPGWGATKGRSARRDREKSRADEMFVDLRQTGCLAEPKDQGHCGSCYAFASVALYEFLYCKATSQPKSFSQQYLIDCGSREQLDGCRGGFLSKTVYFIDNFGLELTDDYAYIGKKRSCPWPSDWDSNRMGSIKPPQKGGFDQLPLEQLEDYLKNDQKPILFNINLTPYFEDYGGGIDSGDMCDEEDVHAMLLVGYGRENGQEFYLFRNSHGPEWGLQGYYKFSKASLAKCSASGVGMITKSEFVPEIKANENRNYHKPSKADKRANRLLKELGKSSSSTSDDDNDNSSGSRRSSRRRP